MGGTMSVSEPELAGLGRAVAERQDRVRAKRDAQGAARRALFAAPAIPGLRPRRPLTWLLAALLGVFAVIVATSWPKPAVTAGDSFDVAEPKLLAFGDGSEITLKPGARARIDRSDGHGASVTLEEGSLFASVVPRREARWWFHAGDYLVHVTGTAFDLSWQASELRIVMHEGSVAITGPGLPAARSVVAGESLVLPEPRSRLVPPPSPPSPPAETPLAAARTTTSSPESWQARAARGDHAGAYETVAPHLAGELSSLDAGSLLRLATVARLSGHSDTARRVYLTLRERFPGTHGAAEAAFALGTLSSGAEAEGWFARALAEAPDHGLAASARGRLLELALQRGDAKAAAADYLRHHPNGAHAAIARDALTP
jgi:transmembrane sensor